MMIGRNEWNLKKKQISYLVRFRFNAEIEKMKYKAGDLMWKCPKCGREFRNTNQDHYCGEKQMRILYQM